MKTELVDVNETRRNMHVEISSDVVDAEIDRHVRDYSRKARLPGFRPGKAPARVVRHRFKEQILHEVAHDLIPRALQDALRERGVEALDVPDVRDVLVEEGRPLTFTASFDTLPAFEPGDYGTLSFRRARINVDEQAVDQAMLRLRERWQDRSRFALRLAITPSVGEWQTLSIPDRLFPMYRAVRGIRLLRRFCGGLRL